MLEIKDRVKAIRKYYNLTQQDLADKLGIKRSTIATYESGRNQPIDAVITLICREFSVNEEWLRNGTGEMLMELDRKDRIMLLAKQLMRNESEEFVDRFSTALSKLDSDGWELLADIAESIVNRNKKGPGNS